MRGLLTIRDAQLRALTTSTRAVFAQRAVAHARKHFGHLAGADEGSLRAHVEASIDQALARGIERESDLLLHLDLTLVVGLGIDAQEDLAWLSAMLRDPELTPSQRVGRAHSELLRRAELLEQNQSTKEAFEHG